MWRAWPVLTFLVACAFDPRSGTTSGDASTADAPSGSKMDAQMPGLDAKPPSDGCVDGDGDGTCDSIEWPCGALPTVPASEVAMELHQLPNHTYQTNFLLSSIDITAPVAGDNLPQRVVAAPGATLGVSLQYLISDTACPGDCEDQIEIGWVPGKRAGCVFDEAVSKQNGAQGTIPAGATITAPTTPGAYDLRTNIGQNFSCDDGGPGVDHNGWWGTDPGPSYTIAKVCVH